jgi:tetratricopeptide (TPR) repeat protein
MECRKLLWCGSLALGAVLGCHRRELIHSDPYNSNPNQVMATERSQRKWGARTVRRKEPDTLVTQTDGKPETLVKIAEVQSQLAVDESRPADQRQKALSLAKHNYQRAIQLDNRHVAAYLGLGRLCSLVGEHSQALATLDDGLAKVPQDASLWFERGMVLGRQQRFEEAISNLKKASQLDPNNSQFVKSVGLMLARAGRADEGVAYLVRVMPEADARYNVGKIMQHIGQANEARRQFEIALRVNPNHEATLAALAASRDQPVQFQTLPSARPSGTTITPPWGGFQPVISPTAQVAAPQPAPSTNVYGNSNDAPATIRKPVRIGFDPGH